jgi:hypothetical protein
MVIRHSEFVTKQLKDDQSKEGAPPSGPMKWFKIIPKAKLLQFDKSSSRYVKKYIYRVIPFELYNTENRSFPNAPGGGPSLKEYNYIFTGKNKDVINLDLNFDMSFFTSLTVNQVNVEQGSGSMDAKRQKDPAVPAFSKLQAKYDEMVKKIIGSDTSFAAPRLPLSSSSGANAGFGTTSKSDKGRQLQAQINQGTSSDMIGLELKIVGDPEFIKTDGISYCNVSPGEKYTPDGSLIMENGNKYITINFKSANDYNSAGMASPDSSYSLGMFSGLYEILEILSEFSGGKFTQTIKVNRFSLQNMPANGGGGGGGGYQGGGMSAEEFAEWAAGGGVGPRGEPNQNYGIASQTNVPSMIAPGNVNIAVSLASAPQEMARDAISDQHPTLGPAATQLASQIVTTK